MFISVYKFNVRMLCSMVKKYLWQRLNGLKRRLYKCVRKYIFCELDLIHSPLTLKITKLEQIFYNKQHFSTNTVKFDQTFFFRPISLRITLLFFLGSFIIARTSGWSLYFNRNQNKIYSYCILQYWNGIFENFFDMISTKLKIFSIINLIMIINYTIASLGLKAKIIALLLSPFLLSLIRFP